MSTLSDRQAGLRRNPIDEHGVVEANSKKALRNSMERKIERIYLDSQELGWSYNGFVTSVLEVLTVLHHRNQKR